MLPETRKSRVAVPVARFGKSRQRNPRGCPSYLGAYGKWDHKLRAAVLCIITLAPFLLCEAVKNEVKKNLRTIIAAAIVGL